MRILVWGMGSGYCHSAEGGAGYHGSECRERGIGEGLALLGHDVHLASAWEGPTDVSGLSRVCQPRPGEYDAVVVCGESGLSSLRGDPALLRAMASHPVSALLVDRPPAGDVDFFRVVGASSEACLGVLDPAPHRLLVPWGSPRVWAPSAMDPLRLLNRPDRSGGPRAIYAGTASRSFVEALNALAEGEGTAIWFAGLLRPSEGHSWGGVSRSERAELCPRLRFLSDLTGESPEFGGGPVRFRDLMRALPYFDVGINLACLAAYFAINCKVVDYHAAGLPVASESGGPDAAQIRAEGGRVVPRGDLQALRLAIDELAANPGDRQARMDRARTRSWTASARVLADALRNVSREVTR